MGKTITKPVKKLSKRGAFYKKAKLALAEIEELGNEALKLKDEDILWLEKKMGPLLDEFETKFRELSIKLDEKAANAIPF